MRPLAALLALLSSLPAVADESRPMPWWVLGALPMHSEKEGPSVEIRSRDEAAKELRWMDGDKMAGTPLAQGVNFGNWMLVLIRCDGNGGAKWDVKGASWEDKTPTITLVREMNPDGNEMAAISSLLVLVPLSDKKVKIVWKDGDVAAMQKERDCACKPTDATPEAEDCPECKKKDASGRGLKFCPECAKARQACASCGKRVPGLPPLKK